MRILTSASKRPAQGKTPCAGLFIMQLFMI